MSNIHDINVSISDADIHAYIDGHLDATARARVEAWLERHPESGAEVRAWQHDAQQLRAALNDLPETAPSAALDRHMTRARWRQRGRQHLMAAAVMALMFSLGGIGGWELHAPAPNEAAPMADALQAYRLFALNHQAQFDVTQRRAGDLQAWLNRHFQHAPPLPNLVNAGFRPVAGRLLATDSGAAAMVLYENAQGKAISFYIRPPSLNGGSLSLGQRRAGRLATAYWSGDGYNLALVGRADTPDMHIIQQAAHASAT